MYEASKEREPANGFKILHQFHYHEPLHTLADDILLARRKSIRNVAF